MRVTSVLVCALSVSVFAIGAACAKRQRGPGFSLVSVNPATAAAETLARVTIHGQGFTPGLAVSLDATSAVLGTNISVSSGTAATAEFNLAGIAPGSFALSISRPDGATATIPSAFQIFQPALFTLNAVDPSFVCGCRETTVTITSPGKFASTPRVELRPHGANAPVVRAARVAFVTSSTLTAVIPGGLPAGSFDVTVVNPAAQGDVGKLADGFRARHSKLHRAQ